MSWKDSLKSLLRRRSDKGAEASQTQDSTDSRIGRAPHELSGVATQFDGVTTESAHKQLVIGLDFGTAFTKVVIGEERQRIAVPLRGDGGNPSDYLLPTMYWSNEDGRCSIDAPTKAQHIDLKMALIEGDVSDQVLVDVAAYLALVLRRVRAFVFCEKTSTYDGQYIDWFVNVGLPTASYHSEALALAYKKAIDAAWIVSAETGTIAKEAVLDILERPTSTTHATHQNALHTEAVSVFPEFVAQVTGYVRSPLRQPDLHLLVDVGAGTMDATVFNVHEQGGEDRFPIFAKAVTPLGTRFLVNHRLGNGESSDRREFAPFAPVPAKKQFAELLGVEVDDLDAADQSFRSNVRKVVGDLLHYSKKMRYPLARQWDSGVPLFLCGGGAHCDFYREALLGSGEIAGIPIVEVKLPMPDALEAPGISKQDYDRISVAYGLSFDPLDIGEIVKEEDVEDIDPTDKPTQGTSTDPICPKCHGTGGLHMPCRHCGGSGIDPAWR